MSRDKHNKSVRDVSFMVRFFLFDLSDYGVDYLPSQVQLAYRIKCIHEWSIALPRKQSNAYISGYILEFYSMKFIFLFF